MRNKVALFCCPLEISSSHVCCVDIIQLFVWCLINAYIFFVLCVYNNYLGRSLTSPCAVTMVDGWLHLRFKGEMGEIADILVKNYFFILLHKMLSTDTNLWLSEVSDLYHCCTIICQAICEFLCPLNTL